MNVKAYLQQIKVLDTKIKQKEEQIEYLKEEQGVQGQSGMTRTRCRHLVLIPNLKA